MERESILLMNALLFEEGHPRRTQHILKVYAMAKTLSQYAGLNESEERTLVAASILHDIAIKVCKVKYGDACQENQRREAPAIIRDMALEAGYEEGDLERITYLVVNHHRYKDIKETDYQVLVEADLLVNIMEGEMDINLSQAERIFKTPKGLELLHNLNII